MSPRHYALRVSTTELAALKLLLQSELNTGRVLNASEGNAAFRAVSGLLDKAENASCAQVVVGLSESEASALDYALGNSMNDGNDHDVFVERRDRKSAWDGRAKLRGALSRAVAERAAGRRI